MFFGETFVEYEVKKYGDIKEVIKNFKDFTIKEFIYLYEFHRLDDTDIRIDVFRNGSEEIEESSLSTKVFIYFKDEGRVNLDFELDGKLDFDLIHLPDPGDEKMGELFFSNIKRKLIKVRLDDFLVKVKPEIQYPKTTKPKVDID